MNQKLKDLITEHYQATKEWKLINYQYRDLKSRYIGSPYEYQKLLEDDLNLLEEKDREARKAMDNLADKIEIWKRMQRISHDLCEKNIHAYTKNKSLGTWACNHCGIEITVQPQKIVSHKPTNAHYYLCSITCKNKLIKTLKEE